MRGLGSLDQSLPPAGDGLGDREPQGQSTASAPAKGGARLVRGSICVLRECSLAALRVQEMTFPSPLALRLRETSASRTAFLPNCRCTSLLQQSSAMCCARLRNRYLAPLCLTCLTWKAFAMPLVLVDVFGV